jgi:hypothetical protein
VIGQKFGELIVLSALPPEGGHGMMLCRCSCGYVCPVRVSNLRRGWTRSCGHLRGRRPHTPETRARLSVLAKAARARQAARKRQRMKEAA